VANYPHIVWTGLKWTVRACPVQFC